MRRFIKLADNISEWCGRIFSFFVVIIIGVSLFEAFTRRILGSPTIWTHETLSYLFCASIMLALGYALRYKAHVKVDLFSGHLSPRGRAILDIVTFFIFLGFFSSILVWVGTLFAATSWVRMERAPSAFNFYVFPAKTLIPVGFFLLLIQGIADFLRNAIFLAKGEQL